MKRPKTSNSNSTLATTRPAKSRVKSSTSQPKQRSAYVQNAAAPCLNMVKTMCAIAPFQPWRNSRRVVILKADKSFCSNPLRVSKWKNYWPPEKPICWISLSACARGGLSRPCWPGTRRPGKLVSNLPQVSSRLEKRQPAKPRLKPPLKAQ